MLNSDMMVAMGRQGVHLHLLQRIVQLFVLILEPLWLMLMCLMSYMVSSKLLCSFLGVLMHGYIRVMLSSSLRLLMNSFFYLSIDCFLCSSMGSLDSLVVGLLCLFMVRRRNCRDELVLLLLWSVNDIDCGCILVSRTRFTGGRRSCSSWRHHIGFYLRK